WVHAVIITYATADRCRFSTHADNVDGRMLYWGPRVVDRPRHGRSDVAKGTSKKTAPQKSPAKRPYYKQSDFPLTSLQQGQKIASALVENFAADSASPPDVALALEISPTSSGWPALTGAAIAYGLVEGGWNATTMKLTPLGKKMVAPEKEGDDLSARREAIL